MLTYVLLLCVLLGFWLLSFKLSGWELVAPVPLVLLGLSVSVLLAMIGLSSWNHMEIGFEVLLIVVIGAASMLVAGYYTDKIITQRCLSGCGEGVVACYVTPVWKYAILGGVLVVAIALRVYETYQIGSEMGLDSTLPYGEVSAAVRRSLASFKSSDGMKIGVGFSVFERQLEKVAQVTGYVASYLLIKACFNKDRKGIICSFTLLVLGCAFCLSMGSRGAILYYAIAVFVVLSIYLYKRGGDTRRRSFRLLIGAMLCAVTGAIVLYASSALVGRKASSGIVEYVSFYFGCGVPSLQSLLNAGAPEVPASGLRSFYFLFSLPYKFGLIDNYPSYSIAWVDMGGHASNIFTGFARPYLDFGFVGLILLSGFCAAAISVVYRWARKSDAAVPMVLIGYVSAYAFDFAREEFLFSRFLGTSQVVSLILMLVITLFLTTSLREDTKSVKAFFSRKRLA